MKKFIYVVYWIIVCFGSIKSDRSSVHSRNLKTGAHRAPNWQKSGDITKKCGPTSYHSPHRSRLSPVGHAFIGETL